MSDNWFDMTWFWHALWLFVGTFDALNKNSELSCVSIKHTNRKNILISEILTILGIKNLGTDRPVKSFLQIFTLKLVYIQVCTIFYRKSACETCPTWALKTIFEELICRWLIAIESWYFCRAVHAKLYHRKKYD